MAANLFWTRTCFLAGIAVLLMSCSAEPEQPKDGEAGGVSPVSDDPAPVKVDPGDGTDSTDAPPDATRAAIAVDPACLATVAWFADRESGDVQLAGCRAAQDLPDQDEQGWRTFESEEGERIMVRGTSQDVQTGAITFEVGYNGGGTLSGLYRVSGKPDGDGVLKAGQYTITPLD